MFKKNRIIVKLLVSIGPAILFTLIIIVIHLAWRFWQYEYNYIGFASQIGYLQSMLVKLTVLITSWVLEHLFFLNISVKEQTIYINSTTYLTINNACSGLKQMVQFLLLMLIFPGKMLSKIFYIPMSIIVLFFTNILRMVILSFILLYKFEWFDFFHVEVTRFLFFVVSFLLWVIYVEKIDNKTISLLLSKIMNKIQIIK